MKLSHNYENLLKRTVSVYLERFLPGASEKFLALETFSIQSKPQYTSKPEHQKEKLRSKIRKLRKIQGRVNFISNLYLKSEKGKIAKRLKEVAKLKAKLSFSSSIGLKTYSRIRKSLTSYENISPFLVHNRS